VWAKTLPETFAPTSISSTLEGEVAVAGVLERGAFEDLSVEGAHVVGAFDATGGVRFVRSFGSARSVDRPRPRVVHDAEGLVVAATEAGEQGARERVVVTAFDRQGRERYRRVFAGPRWVRLDDLVAWPGGGALLAASFEQGVEGISVPTFVPARVQSALLAVIDERGRTKTVRVLPTDAVLALAAHSKGVAVAARVVSATELAGTHIPFVDGRLAASSLVALLDRRSLEPRWMVPFPASLARASLAFASNGDVWFGGGPVASIVGEPLAFDATGKPRPRGLAGEGLVVASAPEPLLLRQIPSLTAEGGSALELVSSGRSTRLEMNVALTEASSGAADRLAALVAPLPPQLHPHCSASRPAPGSIVVLRP
jgi:hypothetical protein